MLKYAGIEVSVEPASNECECRIVARWKPDYSKIGRVVYLGTTRAGAFTATHQADVMELLRHAYEQGRADAALGF
jgi:hypothetical protein